MHVAVISSIVSVLGAGFLGLLYMQFQGLHKAMEKGFVAQSQQIERLVTVVMNHGETLKAHGERLVRIETKLELLIPDPPEDIDPPGSAEAA